MSSKNATRKMENVRMNNNNKTVKTRKNNLSVLPTRARRIIKKKRNNGYKLAKKVRSFREILENHKNGKITNNQRNKQLENTYKYTQARRVYWFTEKEKEKIKRAEQIKKNKAEMGSFDFGEINKKKRGGKKKSRRHKKGGHHELVLLAGAAGMKVYKSLTKKKRRKRRQRKTKRK